MRALAILSIAIENNQLHKPKHIGLIPHPVTHLHKAEDSARAHKTKANALELASKRINGL
jgi:hypothetical protein